MHPTRRIGRRDHQPHQALRPNRALEEIPEHAAKNGAGKESMAARREWRNS